MVFKVEDTLKTLLLFVVRLLYHFKLYLIDSDSLESEELMISMPSDPINK